MSMPKSQHVVCMYVARVSTWGAADGVELIDKWARATMMAERLSQEKMLVVRSS